MQYNNKILEKIERNAKEFEEFNPWHYVSKNTNLIISQLIGLYRKLNEKIFNKAETLCKIENIPIALLHR